MSDIPNNAYPSDYWRSKADAEDKCESVNVNSEARSHAERELAELKSAVKNSGLKPLRFGCELWLIPTLHPESIDTYDAGLLGGGSSWSIEQWHDYLRYELSRAHEFYAATIEQERHQRDVYQKAAATASNYIADDDTFPTTVWLSCGRKVKVECAQPMLEGPQPYLIVSMETHPTFEGKQ